MTRRRGRERGAATIEVALFIPVIVVLLLFTLAGARLSEARGDLDEATREAARAASLRGAPEGAREAAVRSARASLDARRLACAPSQVAVDLSRFFPGGTVAVEVACLVGLDDLAFPGLPTSLTIRSRSVAPIDPLAVRR